jgi:hypothetical protein
MELGANLNKKKPLLRGDSLSGLFTALVLNEILVELDSDLKERALARLNTGDPGDDGLGDTGGYMDDLALALAFDDLTFAIKRFDELGEIHNIQLNRDKTKILSTLDPSVPVENPALLNAFSLLPDSSHLEGGAIYLGIPIGSSTFVSDTLDTAATRFDSMRLDIQNQLQDLQTQVSLFIKCLQPTVSHLLAADVLLHAHNADPDLDPFKWESPFVTRLQESTANFIAYIAGCSVNEVMPGTSAWTIAHLPVALGGLGFQDYSSRAVASFVVPSATAICHAIKGFKL